MMKKVYIAVVVILFLACVVAGLGWLTTEWNLEASQIRIEQPEGEIEQYALKLEEANKQTVEANRQTVITNSQIELATQTIEGLSQELVAVKRGLEITKQRPRWKELSSLAELKDWLAENDNDNSAYYFGGFADFTKPYDCDDYAVALMINAWEDGYLISTEIVMETGKPHMINSTIIGNKIYFIEPQTDKVWLWGYRD